MTQPDPLDREVCLCFHVSLRKLEKFCRLDKPRVASQLSNCYSAGTGCGWCIPFLDHIHEQVRDGKTPTIKMTAEEYRNRRSRYHTTGQRDPFPEPESEASENPEENS